MSIKDAYEALRYCESWAYDEYGQRQLPEYVEDACIKGMEALKEAEEKIKEQEEIIKGAQVLIYESKHLVRCRDCIYSVKDESSPINALWCERFAFHRTVVLESSYCAFGQRRHK